MDIQAAKLELIRMIADIENEALLKKLKALLINAVKGKEVHVFQEDAVSYIPEWLEIVREPIPESIDLKELARSQKYDPKKLAFFFANLDRNAWKDENVKELLDSLTK